MQPSEVKLHGATDVLPSGSRREPCSSRAIAPSAARKPAPAIGARAATDADDDVAASVIECLRNHRPRPWLDAVIGAAMAPGSRCKPQISAISTTAVFPLRAYAVWTTWPVGPVA